MLLTPLARAYVFSVFAVLPALVLGVSVLGPVWIIRRRHGLEWYDLARYVYPFRRAVSLLVGLELSVGLILSLIVQARLGLAADRWFLPASILGLLTGIAYSLYLIHRRTGGECRTFGSWIAMIGSVMSVRLLTGAAIVAVGVCLTGRMPLTLAWSLAWIFGCALSMAGFPLWILRLLRRIEPAAPELTARGVTIAERLAIAPPRRILVLKYPLANGYAMPLLKQVLVTSRLLTVLDSNEVDSILAHEFGHLSESRSDVLKRAALGVFFIPIIFGALFNSGNLAIFLPLLLAAFFLLKYSGEFSRRLEKRADEIASRAQTTGGEYAQALLKVYRCNLVPTVMRRRERRTHPDLYDRMISAGSQPQFSRPLPPVRFQYFAPCLFAVTLNSLLFAGLYIAVPAMPAAIEPPAASVGDPILLDEGGNSSTPETASPPRRTSVFSI